MSEFANVKSMKIYHENFEKFIKHRLEHYKTRGHTEFYFKMNGGYTAIETHDRINFVRLSPRVDFVGGDLLDIPDEFNLTHFQIYLKMYVSAYTSSFIDKTTLKIQVSIDETEGLENKISEKSPDAIRILSEKYHIPRDKIDKYLQIAIESDNIMCASLILGLHSPSNISEMYAHAISHRSSNGQMIKLLFKFNDYDSLKKVRLARSFQ